jgi:hypothetical protein
MKPVAAVVTLVLLLPAVHARQSRPDYAGLWKMDESRSSSAAQAGFAGPVTWRIALAGGQMTVEIQRGPKAYTLTYTIDEARAGAAGAGAASPGYRGYWEGDALVTDTTQTIQGQTVTTREVRTLARDGQEMIVERTVNVHHGYTVRGAQSSSTARDTFVRAAP